MFKKTAFIAFILFFTSIYTHAQTEQTCPPCPQNQSLIQQVEKWYEQNMNYSTITILMTIESSFIPFPSEIVIPPAAYIASKPDSKLNIFLVVFFGTLGALFGAIINYVLALTLGRVIVHKFADSKMGKLLMLNSEK
jgi:membrane protein DedA with SNARE-associated domain